MTEEYGKRGLRSMAPDTSEVTSSCDLGTEPDLRKSESKGRNLEREIAPSLFELVASGLDKKQLLV